MARLPSTLLAIALAPALLLAGCAGTPGDLSPSTGAYADQFTRAVQVDVDGTEMAKLGDPATAFELFQTTYTFTEPVGRPVVGVDVTFTDASGALVTKPLSAFTDKAVLALGDKVEIPGVHLTSSIKLTAAGEVLAERLGTSPDWLKMNGGIIPLAAQPGAGAHYIMSSESSFGVAFDKASLAGTENPAAITVSDLDVSGKLAGSGTFDLAAAAKEDAMAVTGKLALKEEGSFTFGAVISGNENGDGDGEYGLKSTGLVDLVGTSAMTFGPSGDLRSMGTGGSIKADADVKLLSPGHDGYRTPETFQGEHPLYERSLDLVEEPVPAAPAVAPEMQQMLANLYGLTLVPGDRFTLVAQLGEEATAVAAEYRLTVASKQARQVGDAVRDALKLQGTVTYTFQHDGKTDEAYAFSFTYFVDAKSLLPLSLEGESAQAISQQDLQAFYALMGESLPTLTLPETMTLSAMGKGSLALTSVQDGFQTAAIGHAFAFSTPLVVAGAMSTMLVGRLSALEPQAPEAAPVAEA